MTSPLLPRPDNQQRIFSNLDVRNKGIRASDSRWDWFGRSIKYRGEDNKDHYINRTSAKKFLKANKVDIKNLKNDDILKEVNKLGFSNIINPQSTDKANLSKRETEFPFSPSVASLLGKADKGDKEAQFQLGNIFFNGTKGVQEDKKRAFDYYKLAADKGQLSAIYCVAENYENGYGIEKDLNQALEYYRIAAEKGDKKASKKVKELESQI